MERGPVFIGIDVSKAHLDVAVLSSGETWQEPNDEAGIAHLVGRVRALGPTLAQIHRRDDYAAAERAIGAREGNGPGTIWGRGGPVSVFSCRGETL